jgi:hypothetical protein
VKGVEILLKELEKPGARKDPKAPEPPDMTRPER